MVALLCVSLAGVAQTANDKIYFRNDVEVCPKNPQLERYLKTSLKYPEEAIQQNMQKDGRWAGICKVLNKPSIWGAEPGGRKLTAYLGFQFNNPKGTELPTQALKDLVDLIFEKF